MKKGHHVVQSVNGGWSVRRSGAVRASRNFTTQADAVTYAREQARKEHGELYVHRRDGTISRRDSYGNDPHPARGNH